MATLKLETRELQLPRPPNNNGGSAVRAVSDPRRLQGVLLRQSSDREPETSYDEIVLDRAASVVLMEALREPPRPTAELIALFARRNGR